MAPRRMLKPSVEQAALRDLLLLVAEPLTPAQTVRDAVIQQGYRGVPRKLIVNLPFSEGAARSKLRRLVARGEVRALPGRKRRYTCVLAPAHAGPRSEPVVASSDGIEAS